MTLEVSNVTGVDSGDDASVTYDGTGETLESNEFSVIPVRISNVEMVSNYGSNYVIDTTISDGNEVNVGIIRITADSWANSNTIDGSELNLLLSGITVNSTASSGDVSNFTIRRVDISNGTEVSGTVSGNDVSFDLSSLTAANTEIESGEVAYFLVQADVSYGTSNASFKINLKNLDNGAFVYATDDANLGTYDELRLGVSQKDGVQINVSNN